MEIALALNLHVGIAGLELGAVLDVPLGHEVVLHPDDLVEGLDEGDFALDVEARVRQDSLVHDVLDEAEARAQVDVFDVEGVFSAKANVHHAIYLSVSFFFSSMYRLKSHLPDFIEILPKLHLARVRTQLIQVRAQKHLAMQNLRAVLVGDLIEGAFEGCAPGGEGARGNVILEELFVDDVDDGGDERLDVFGVADEGFDITYVSKC